jgi:hypothetical protein
MKKATATSQGNNFIADSAGATPGTAGLEAGIISIPPHRVLWCFEEKYSEDFVVEVPHSSRSQFGLAVMFDATIACADVKRPAVSQLLT